MPDLRRIGREAEDRAADYLIAKGYTIVTRRYQTRRGEIDLVALDGEEIVFVEVKLRQTPGYRPEEAVGEKKHAALIAAAQTYLQTTETPNHPHRYDLIAIDKQGIRHYERAF